MTESFESLSFYRGISSGNHGQFPMVKSVRKNRRPRNMPEDVHERADAWFLSRFGVNYRSQSLFVTSSLLVAQNYANSPDNVVRIIPIGPYRYCWSPNRSDLLFYCSNNEGVPIEEYLEASGYIEKHLRSAYESGNEVMLFCERYITIPINILDDQKGKTPDSALGSIIILPK